MNENTTKLLQALAEKLGTTANYLWGVLIKQARVDATITLIQILIVVIYGVLLYKLHKRFSKKPNGKHSYNLYDEFEGIIILPMIIGVITLIGCSIWAIGSISDVINGYFNPEYWALKQILDNVK